MPVAFHSWQSAGELAFFEFVDLMGMVSTRTLVKTRLSFMFFTVILNGLKKFRPNNWLAKTPKALALRRLGRQSAERERISEINSNVFKKKKLQAGSSRTLVKTRLSFMFFYSNP